MVHCIVQCRVKSVLVLAYYLLDVSGVNCGECGVLVQYMWSVRCSYKPLQLKPSNGLCQNCPFCFLRMQQGPMSFTCEWIILCTAVQVSNKQQQNRDCLTIIFL